MDAASSAILRKYLEGCVQDIFSAAGLKLQPTQKGEVGRFVLESRVLGFISFTGNQMRGSITLSLPTALVSRLYPHLVGAAVDAYDLRDCTGELLNQIVGRLKSCLLKHAIVFKQSAPSTLSAARGRPPRLVPPGAIELHFGSSEGEAIVTFDAVARRAVDLTSSVPNDADNPILIKKSGLFD